MRKLFLATALASCLALTNCVTTATDSTVANNITAAATQAQALVSQACGYVAPIAEVAAIITSFTGGGATAGIVTQAAQAICAAVTNKGASLGGPQVNGIVLHGHFMAGRHR